MKKNFILAVGVFLIVCTDKPLVCAESPASFDCAKIFTQTGACPDDFCSLTCQESSDQKPCDPHCAVSPCYEIRADKCPLDRCDILLGCEGKKICFERNNEDYIGCGDLAFWGQEAECCQGLVRRCGVEFFDGSCDMLGQFSSDAVPICIPCGDDICGQFENRCNCPEDCGEGSYRGFVLDKIKETSLPDRQGGQEAQKKNKRK